MSNKDKYRLLCNTEKNIPIFSHDWWLDTVCGEKKWDVLLIEQKGRIQATLPLYVPHSDIVSMPSYTQTMGPWFAASSSDTKYTTELGRRQELCKQFTEELKRYPHFLQNFNYDITDWLPFYWAGYNQTTRYTYLLKNIRDHQAVWENMSPNIRRNITKAQNKYHISVKKGIPLNEFLAVQTQTATYSVAGSGDLLTEGYEAQRVTASVAGSGSIKCFATEFLKARTSGSGKIGYKGNPELDYPKKSLYKL